MAEILGEILTLEGLAVMNLSMLISHLNRRGSYWIRKGHNHLDRSGLVPGSFQFPE